MERLAADRARDHLARGMLSAARNAGTAVWDIYQSGFEVFEKADASPVTIADDTAEAIILAALALLAPGVPVVAEEAAAAGHVPEVGDRFFLVDPLDGTKEFIQRSGDFTVNIALVEHGSPTLGVVYAPAKSLIYVGDTASSRAWRAPQKPWDGADDGEFSAIRVRRVTTGLTAVASRSHATPETDAYLTQWEIAERVSVGSSLKFCLVAEGAADLYPRAGPTMEWDTAAGHAVLIAAGGRVLGVDGAPLVYGKPRFFNPGFVASGDFDTGALGALG